MDIDKLIALSDFGFWETWWAGAFNIYTILTIIAVFVFFIAFTESASMSIVVSILVSLLIGFFIGEETLHDEFKEEHFKPYISKLEYEKFPIDDIHFLEYEQLDPTYFTKKELKGKKISSVLIIYSDKGEVTPLKTNVLIKTDVEDIEDIYMEYKVIPKDIPNILSKGRVNHIVHIPKDFFKKKLLLKETGSTE